MKTGCSGIIILPAAAAGCPRWSSSSYGGALLLHRGWDDGVGKGTIHAKAFVYIVCETAADHLTSSLPLLTTRAKVLGVKVTNAEARVRAVEA